MKTRHTSPISLAVRAPRNPFVAAARARKAGSHRPPAGARRQQAQRELQRLLQGEALLPRTDHRHRP